MAPEMALGAGALPGAGREKPVLLQDGTSTGRPWRVACHADMGPYLARTLLTSCTTS
jgi:hypothetical protein